MLFHDTVVRRIKTFHERIGDDVTAELLGYQRPPKFYGPLGRAYLPDVFVFDRRWVYEVKEYGASIYSVPKMKAFSAAPDFRAVLLVLCTGPPGGSHVCRRSWTRAALIARS